VTLLQVTPYTVPLVLASLVMALLAIHVLYRFALRVSPVPGAVPFSLLLLSVTWWTGVSAAEMACTELASKLLWANLSYIGIGAVPAFWVLFTLRQCAPTAVILQGRRAWWLMVVPIMTVLVALTDEYHGWFRTSAALTRAGGGFEVLTATMGPWFWIHAVYSYFLLLTASWMLLRWVRRSPTTYRGQVFAVLIAGIAPWAANALYLSGLSPLPLLDMTPFGFVVTGIAIALGLFRYHLLDVVPVGRDAVLEDLEDGVMIIDLAGRLADLNPAAGHLLGVASQMVIGQSASQVCEKYPDLEDWLTSESAMAQIEVPVGDRTVVTWDVRRNVLHQAGQAAGQLIVLRDISEQRRQQQLQVQTQRLGAVGELALGVSHNLNNLLTGIIAPVGIALADCKDERVRRELHRIRDSADRAADVVRRLGQAVRGGPTPGIKPVEVAGVIAEAIEAARPRWQDESRAAGRMIVLTSHTDRPLPQVGADRSELLDVLLNLILNAVDAMPDGGDLAIEAIEQDQGVGLQVCDTGVGMTDEVRQRIFEPFFTTKADVGTGLGLSTAYNSIQGWGGTIEVESQPEGGARFRLWLPPWIGEFPEVDDVPSTESATPEASAAAGDTLSSTRARALVVEDEAIVGLLMSDRLQAGGVDVTLFQDGATAARQADGREFDLAFVDLSLPGMAGDEVARQLRTQNPAIVLVLISGWDLADEDPRLAPFDAFLQKPFDVAVLDRALGAALQLTRQRQH
jgi:PAS domain S-box-containing protein